MNKQPQAQESPAAPSGAARSNKTLMDRYDALVQRVQDRVEATESSGRRLLLLALITRLNKRGMRELERRQRASEEQLWQESLVPEKRRSRRSP